MHFTVNPFISRLSVGHHRYKPDFYLGESLIYFNRFIRLKRTWSHEEPVLGFSQGRSATAPKQRPGERPGPVNHQRYLFHIRNFSHPVDKGLLWQDIRYLDLSLSIAKYPLYQIIGFISPRFFVSYHYQSVLFGFLDWKSAL
jgi:hypothetical protein